MEEGVWVIKKYHVPKESVQHDLVGQWIYNCKKGNAKSAEENKDEQIKEENKN